MPAVLHLLPHLGVGGAAKQVLLTAPALAGRFAVRVAALGPAGDFAGELRRVGLEPLALRRPGDTPLAAARRLVRLLSEARPDVIHTWGPAAWRTAAAL